MQYTVPSDPQMGRCLLWGREFVVARVYLYRDAGVTAAQEPITMKSQEEQEMMHTFHTRAHGTLETCG